jgi:hypothetical protein
VGDCIPFRGASTTVTPPTWVMDVGTWVMINRPRGLERVFMAAILIVQIH